MRIHPTAIVDPSAHLGPGVDVGPFAVIGPEVQVGAACQIGPHAVIHRYVTLGEHSQVHAHAVLGDLPQDLAFKEAASHVRIGRNVVIREGVTIHRGTKEGTVTEVGDGCFLMANSHLAHNVKLGQGVIVANNALLAGYVEVGDKAFISGNTSIHQFVRIGRLAMVGGAAGLSADLPPFCIAHPLSVNELAGLNTVGLRRNGFSSPDRLALRQVFHRLFRSGTNRRQALAQLSEENLAPAARELVDFVAVSKRGVCHARRRAGDPEAVDE